MVCVLKIPKIKHAEKIVRICHTRLSKLNFETRPKKTHFLVFAKNFRRPWMKLKIFFCQFPNPWALRVSGMGCYTSKCEKSQNHCTLINSTFSLGRGEEVREKIEGQEYTSIVPSSMVATVHKLGRKYQPMSECISSL